MSTQPKTFLTPEEYLERERKADHRSEYLDGEVFAMAGATKEHDRIVVNLTGNLYAQLKDAPCEIHSADLRVRVGRQGPYTYPDIAISCGGAEFEDAELDTLLNPVVIIEVLSPSTEAYDRGLKFEMYRKIESLAEYIMVSQNRVHIDRYVKQSDGKWLLFETGNLEDSIEISSIRAILKVADIYHRVFPPS